MRAALYSARREPQRLNVPPGKSCHSSLGRRVRKVTPPPRHWALTDSRPSANVTLLIRRVADLAAVLLDSLLDQPVGSCEIA
jgi:hypothetical protein